MALKVFEDTNIKAIADTIRTSLKVETKYTTKEMAKGVKAVYEKGLLDGGGTTEQGGVFCKCITVGTKAEGEIEQVNKLTTYEENIGKINDIRAIYVSYSGKSTTYQSATGIHVAWRGDLKINMASKTNSAAYEEKSILDVSAKWLRYDSLTGILHMTLAEWTRLISGTYVVIAITGGDIE